MGKGEFIGKHKLEAIHDHLTLRAVKIVYCVFCPMSIFLEPIKPEQQLVILAKIF
jgi:hypothetical protein